jgi:septum formation protein
MQLILASSSRYRRTMLSRLHIPFDVESPDIDETPQLGEAPADLARRLSKTKADTVAARHPGAVVIGSDQVACLADGSPIGKPGNFDNARAQLRRLSGRQVEFHSGLCVTDGSRHAVGDIVTRCRFRDLSDGEIDTYLHIEQPYDTAGSAKAEGLGIALLESMTSDDPTAIIGLPLIELCRMLRTFDIDPLPQTTRPAP